MKPSIFSVTFLSQFTLILLFCISHIQAASVYELDTSYSGSSFFNGFDFFTAPDPTNGFVDYINADTAQAAGYATPNYRNGAAYMGVDDITILAYPGTGRKSVRITSQKSWTHGLFISDIAHMPGGICGVWPAHWTLGPNWPANGEIDIIEGVNSADQNLMSLHTSPGCTMTSQNDLGNLITQDCDSSVNYNSGCGIEASSTATYGSNFNANGGGVFATEWTSDAITIWFFPRNNIPQDIIEGNPNPTSWTEAQGIFEGGNNCNIDSHFASHQIVFDTTFCGGYGDALWASDPVCKTQAASCEAFVASKPSAFTNAYWLVNSVKVYTLASASASAAASTEEIPTSTEEAAASSMQVFTSANQVGASTKEIAASTENIPTSAEGAATSMENVASSTQEPAYTSLPYSTVAPAVDTLAPAAQSSLSSPYSGSNYSLHGFSTSKKPAYVNPTAMTTNPTALQSIMPSMLPERASNYYGCFQYSSSSFIPIISSDNMDHEICLGNCRFYKYAGLFDEECFCAQSLDSTNPQFPDADCNIPCSGDESEKCGGMPTTAILLRRGDDENSPNATHGILVSVFEILNKTGMEQHCHENATRIEPTVISTSSLQKFIPPPSYHILGCIGSSNNFSGFGFLELDSFTAFEFCFQICTSSSRYIAAGPTGCYCGNTDALAEGSGNYIVPTNYCDYPCPKHQDEICGGETSPYFPLAKPESVIYSYKQATRIGAYLDLACIGSSANFTGLRLIPHPTPTLEVCFEACQNAGGIPSRYVAAWTTGCYCADTDSFLHNPDTFDVEIRFCNIRCQGTNEDCGGHAPPGSNPPFLLLIYIFDPIQPPTLSSGAGHNASQPQSPDADPKAKLTLFLTTTHTSTVSLCASPQDSAPLLGCGPEVVSVTTTVICIDCNAEGEVVLVTTGSGGALVPVVAQTTQLQSQPI